MDQEKDLIQKLTLLKKVKPKDNWVLFAKNRILEQGVKMPKEVGHMSLIGQLGHFISHVRYFEKPAYIFAALAFVVISGIGYNISQNSLPGDALYSVRSVIEKATIGNNPLASLEVAQRRLKDLRKVVEENKVKNLSSATHEFNLSVAEVSKDLLALVENEPDKALQASMELVQLQKDKAQIEQILGAVIGAKEALELTSATKVLVEAELNDLLDRTLTNEQEDLLEEAIIAYQAQDYEKALENIWSISN